MDKLLVFLSLTRLDAMMICVGALLFAALWRCMELFVFARATRLLAAREAATFGSEDKATTFLADAQKLTEEKDAALAATRAQAMTERVSIVESAKKEAAVLISEAEKSAEELLAAAHTKIQTETEETAAQLQGQVSILSKELSQKIIAGQLF